MKAHTISLPLGVSVFGPDALPPPPSWGRATYQHHLCSEPVKRGQIVPGT